MKCEKCNCNSKWLWSMSEGNVCGSCAIQLVEPETDLDTFKIVSDRYKDQFTPAPRTSNTAVEIMINGVIDRCMQQTR